MTPCQVTSDGPPEVRPLGNDPRVEAEPDETEDLSSGETITDRFEIEDRRADSVPDVLAARPR